MKTKIIVIITLVFFLVSLSPSMASQETNEGNGYLWISNIQKDLENANFTGTAKGIRVYGLYVEYLGKDKNMLNFSFMGSFYSSTYLNGKLNVDNPSQVFAWKNSKTLKWINYNGYALLELYNTSSNEKIQKFYGIKKIFIHMYTKEPEKASGELNYTWSPAGSIVQKFDYTLSYNLSFMINYSRPLPYIPINSTDENVSYYTTANFTGVVSAKGTGYSKTGNKTTNLNKIIDTNFSGNVQMRTKMNSHGNEVNRSGIIELLPIRIGMTDLAILYNPNSTFRSSIVFASMITDTSIMKDKQFTSITLSMYNFGMDKYVSKSTTKSIIEKIMNDEGQIQSSIELWKEPSYYIITVVPIALGILLLILSIKHRKNTHNGTT